MHDCISGLTLLFHHSICLALYQYHSRQKSLNGYWPRLCSLGIRRIKVSYSEIRRILKINWKSLDLTWGAKGCPSMSQRREIMNEHLRKINLGIKLSLSVGLRKECRGHCSGPSLRSQGTWMKEVAVAQKGRDASKRHLEEKTEMMALCYESMWERGDWKGQNGLETERWFWFDERDS